MSSQCSLCLELSTLAQMKETLAAKQNNDIPHAFFDQTFTFYEIDKLQEEAAVGWYRRWWFQTSWIEIGQNRSSPRIKELFIERNQSLKSPTRKVCWVVAGILIPQTPAKLHTSHFVLCHSANSSLWHWCRVGTMTVSSACDGDSGKSDWCELAFSVLLNQFALES